MEITQIWNKTKEVIRNKVGEDIFNAWFNTLQPSSITEKKVAFEVPDAFFKEWIMDNYIDVIRSAITEACGINAAVIELNINPNLYQALDKSRLASYAVSGEQKKPESCVGLNPRYNLNSFVIGNSNRFAHAACVAVSDSPAKAYNPLFIYGGVGLGKTHLIQGICQNIFNKHPNQYKICYTPSEQFTNELIDSIQHRRTNQFRQKYRMLDVLVIDDIHFIAGKESTQEEFFHTFNALYDNHKQIIITSDRNPKEISHLEERLISRFAWGLITDVQPPDFELRVAILRKKIEKEPVSISDEVIEFIANIIKTNVRELEGALVKVIAYSLLEEKPITLELAKDVLKDLLQEENKLITIDAILKVVSQSLGIGINDLRTGKRQKTIVQARQIAMYLARELTAFSLPEIGDSFGGKDHTTVLYSYEKIKKGIPKDKNLKNKIDQLIKEVKQR